MEAVEVPGYTGLGLPVDAGSMIRIVDVEGAQICDLFALVREEPSELLCTARTRAVTQRLFPAVGQAFVTNRYRPILTFVADHSPGVHDSLFASCDPGLHELLGGGSSHPNCHENFLAAARNLGLDVSSVPGPVNFFQSTPVRPDGSLGAERAPTQPGDSVELRAELDIFLVVTACSVDTGVDINGGRSTSLRVEISIPVGLPETLRTDRLELRPFAQSDGPAVFAYSQDPDWAEYQQTTPSSEREAERVVAELLLRDWADQPAWAITHSGEVVGLVSLVFSAEHRIALLGYGIHESHRGLGLTGEAVRAVLTEAFAVHEQLTKVTANTDARNRSSIRLLEKLGFTHEGTLRSGGVNAKGDLVDGAIHGLLRSEWRVAAG